MNLHADQQLKETLMYAAYYAPRGRNRLYYLGKELANRHLFPTDLVIGIIGAAGAGKSTLIRGLFPGLELTNDDEGINVRPTPLFDFSTKDLFSGHTFHIDVRYERAFHQPHEIAEAVTTAINHNRRVIIEHFDMIYEQLGYNAQILIGIGEEVIVARPTVFGPAPSRIKNIVYKTIRYRLMAHSAEDITSIILENEYGYQPPDFHSDVKHGFIIGFPEKPQINIDELEKKVLAVIERDVKICTGSEDHIFIGDVEYPCTGVRTHVSSSGKIENFRLLKELKYHPITKEYLLVGVVGREEIFGFEDIMPVVV